MFVLKTVLIATFLATTLSSEITSRWRVLTPEQSAANKLFLISQGWNITTSTFNYRADAASSTYGDLVTGPRTDGDVLYVRDIIVLDQVTTEEQQWEYTATAPSGRSFTAIRSLNFGIDRAFAQSIFISGDRKRVSIYYDIEGNLDPRVLVEVYT